MKNTSCSVHRSFTLGDYDQQWVQVQKEGGRAMITNRIEVETAIVQHLETQGSCTIEELVHSLSHFTLNQVFFTIDRLSREGKVSLRHPTRFAYLVSAVSSGPRNRAGLSVDR
jgi:glucokinase